MPRAQAVLAVVFVSNAISQGIGPLTALGDTASSWLWQALINLNSKRFMGLCLWIKLYICELQYSVGCFRQMPLEAKCVRYRVI